MCVFIEYCTLHERMVSVSMVPLPRTLTTESLTNKGVTVIVSLIASKGLLEQIYGSDAFYCNTFSSYIYIETYCKDSTETHESDFNSECNSCFGRVVYF